MKALLLIIGYCMLLSWSMSTTKPKQEHINKIIPVNYDSVHFQSHVVPLLQKKCSPCHFEGGKMYARMPFDKEATLMSHRDGILKRFSAGDEKTLLQNFIQGAEQEYR